MSNELGALKNIPTRKSEVALYIRYNPTTPTLWLFGWGVIYRNIISDYMPYI